MELKEEMLVERMERARKNLNRLELSEQINDYSDLSLDNSEFIFSHQKQFNTYNVLLEMFGIDRQHEEVVEKK